MWFLLLFSFFFFLGVFFSVSFTPVLDDATRIANTEEIVIPFGVGIAGTVAQTKNTVNIKNAYEDPRFNCEIDQKTGYKTKNILSMPICNYEGDVIGVAQIINKTKGKQYTALAVAHTAHMFVMPYMYRNFHALRFNLFRAVAARSRLRCCFCWCMVFFSFAFFSLECKRK